MSVIRLAHCFPGVPQDPKWRGSGVVVQRLAFDVGVHGAPAAPLGTVAVALASGLTPDATLRAAEILYERDWSMLARDVLEDQMWWTPDSLRGLTKRLLTDLDLPSTLSVRARVSCVF